MKSYETLVAEALEVVPELMPWDLQTRLDDADAPLLLDVREPEEYQAMHIPRSIHVPRGILEAAVQWGFEETVPTLVQARDTEVVVICRSGRRSALAARTLVDLGFGQVRSLKLGVRGWNDDGGRLEDADGNEVDPEQADEYFRARVREDQMGPQNA